MLGRCPQQVAAWSDECPERFFARKRFTCEEKQSTDVVQVASKEPYECKLCLWAALKTSCGVGAGFGLADKAL
ncbi:hypothetical protein CFRS1_v001014 [Colletotrichum fructicola]|nr:hypothetical protein CFRS1_v001014 [Colletotrichum fructicola]